MILRKGISSGALSSLDQPANRLNTQKMMHFTKGSARAHEVFGNKKWEHYARARALYVCGLWMFVLSMTACVFVCVNRFCAFLFLQRHDVRGTNCKVKTNP